MRPFRDSLFAEEPSYGVRDGWDPNDLLHPSEAFEHPSHVLNDPDLTLNENAPFLLRGHRTRAPWKQHRICDALQAASNRFCSTM